MIPTQRLGLIKCIPFDISLKDFVIDQVLLKNVNLSKNYSFEGGFELPLTNEWSNNNLINKDLLKYHNSRQIRFVIKEDKIIGVRLKDSINYMTDDEINNIIYLINSIIEQ